MAKHVSNFRKDSLNIVLDLLNEQNGTTFTPAHLAITHVGDGNTKPTVMHVQAKTGSGYGGSVDMNYNRILLNEVPSIVEDITEVDAITADQLVADINTRYGLNISLSEITVDGAEVTPGAGAPIDLEFDRITEVNISAKGNKSLVWVGDVNVRYTRMAQLLSQIWPLTNLDGLYPPALPVWIDAFPTAQMVITNSSFFLSGQAYDAKVGTSPRDEFDITHLASPAGLNLIFFPCLCNDVGEPLPLEKQSLQWTNEYMTMFMPWSQLEGNAQLLEQTYGISIARGSCMCVLTLPADFDIQSNWSTRLYSDNNDFSLPISGKRIAFKTTFKPTAVYVEDTIDGQYVTEEEDRGTGSNADMIRILGADLSGEAVVYTATEPTLENNLSKQPIMVVVDETRTSTNRYGRLVMECDVMSESVEGMPLEFVIVDMADPLNPAVIEQQGENNALGIRLATEGIRCEYDNDGNPIQFYYQSGAYTPGVGADFIISDVFAYMLPSANPQQWAYGVRFAGTKTIVNTAFNPSQDKDSFAGAAHDFTLTLQSQPS